MDNDIWTELNFLMSSFICAIALLRVSVLFPSIVKLLHPLISQQFFLAAVFTSIQSKDCTCKLYNI